MTDRKQANRRVCLTSRVDHNKLNFPQDVMKVKKALRELEMHDSEAKTGFPKDLMSRDLEKSIKRFQYAQGLEVDGILKPGGETERALNENLELKKKKEECSVLGITKKTLELRKIMDERNPISQTGIGFIDNAALKTIPTVGKYAASYNTGHSIGRKVATVKAAIDENCK